MKKEDKLEPKKDEKLKPIEAGEVNKKDTAKVIEEKYGISLTALSQQIQSEYTLAWKHQKPKKDKYLVRLKLFNNQKRDDDAVGDTTLFSIFQTVFATLYNDRLSVDFRGREEGDETKADNINALAKVDYDDMEKNVLDYFWDWNTCFFGRALISTEEFVRDPANNIFLMKPSNIDPITWLRDPYASSVNGIGKNREGAMRFGGSEIKMNKYDIEDHPSFFSDIEFSGLKYGSDTYSLLTESAQARDEAQGNQNVNKDSESNLGVNAQYTITRWFTHCEINGEIRKVKVWLANDRSKIIGLKIFDRDYWPLIDRALYPHSGDWDGTSIPDLVEDKQRARAIAQNLGLKAMKADLYPMYIYDTNKIKNKSDLNFDFNKPIGVDALPGEPVTNSVAPMIKSRPNMGLLQFIYESLDASAQKATATPDVKQGLQPEKDRTLGETNLLVSGSDTRYSLGAKVFFWSEKAFWRHWYHGYVDYFGDDIDEKVLRVVGAFGSKWRPIKKSEIICNLDPDIYIESSNISRAKDLEDRALLTGYLTSAMADPTCNRRYALKKLAKLNGMQKDEIDRLFPPTVDERIAEDQNTLLNDDKLVPVLPEDDHNTHLIIHSMAKDTSATKVHIETHKKALSIKKTQPGLFPETNPEVNNMSGQPLPTQGQPAGGIMNIVGANRTQQVAPSQTSNQQ